MTNTKTEYMHFAAKYYSFHIDRYVYDVLNGSGEYCLVHSFYCKLIGIAFLPDDGSHLNDPAVTAHVLGLYPHG